LIADVAEHAEIGDGHNPGFSGSTTAAVGRSTRAVRKIIR
jgi:hypothetical protein